MNPDTPKPPVYGLMAEFDSADAILQAAKKTHSAGYRNIDAFSPLPIHGLAEAIGFHKSGVPQITLIGGILGGLAGFGLQYWINVIEYPLNVGGRPFNSWPAFIPVTFECTILVAAFSTVLGMLALNGLPRPHHPVFGVDSFQLASQDSFFLLIESKDSRFRMDETRKFLEGLGGRVSNVDWD